MKYASFSNAPRRAFILIALFAAASLLTSCELEDAFGPDILSMTVDPSVISTSNAGMTDEYFDIAMTTTGFEGTFESAEVFIQVPGGEDIPSLGTFSTAEPGDMTTIFSEPQSITTSWFEGLDVGVYNLGATIRTDLEDYTELDLATVQVVSPEG